MIETAIVMLDDRDRERKAQIEENRSVVEEVKRENENLLFMFREKETENDSLLTSINDLETESSNDQREKDCMKNDLNKINALYNKDVEENRQLEKVIGDLGGQVKSKEKTLEYKMNAICELNDKIAWLKNSNTISEGDNNLVRDQIRHTINLNKEILEEMGKFTEADAQIRVMLDRKDQYTELLERSNHQLRD